MQVNVAQQKTRVNHYLKAYRECALENVTRYTWFALKKEKRVVGTRIFGEEEISHGYPRGYPGLPNLIGPDFPGCAEHNSVSVLDFFLISNQVNIIYNFHKTKQWKIP